MAEIRRRLGGGGGTGVRLGIGDDAAVVRSPKELLLTKDLLVEGVDFRRSLHPPRLLGRKSLNVNLSDIAAMGGRPLHAVLGLALPGETEREWLSEFLAGFREASREAGVALVGGDISEAREILISVTVTGEAGPFVPRSGARPGDLVFVSGSLGDAAAGLRLLKKGTRQGKNRAANPLIKAFLDPAPRLELGSLLARRKLASAMIDVSDGLSVDLAHICEESGVGAEVELGRVPISGALRRFMKNPLLLALDGGEDFELLFTVRPRNVPRLRRLGPLFKITEIGRITAEKRIVIVDSAGRKKPLAIRGYEHFK
ncbi:MAG: thiamine-phosphate kinase [Candidatus Aminicenantales bacterium]